MNRLLESSETPQGFGLRQSSAAFGRGTRSKRGRGLPHSKTLARPRKRELYRGLNNLGGAASFALWPPMC